MTYKNKYDCGVRIWRKLDWAGRATYNEVYSAMRKREFICPTTKSFSKSLITDKDWEIICHNAAVIAAWAADQACHRLAA